MSVKQCDFLEAHPPSKKEAARVEDQLPLCPGQAVGSYRLNLANAYHRLLSSVVVELAAKYGGSQTIQNIFYQPDLQARVMEGSEAETFEMPDLDAENGSGSLQVPSQGTLEFTFHWGPADSFKKPELPDQKFRPFVNRLKRIGEGDERLVLKILDVVISAFALLPPQIREMMECVNSSTSKILLAMMVFPHMLEMEGLPQLFGSLKPHELEQVEQRLGKNLFWFNPANPTGHYRLNLALPTDRLVAQRLFELNAMEKALRADTDPPKPDLSQKGTGDMFRNETLDDKQFQYTEDFVLPTKGWLAFDFVSQLRSDLSQVLSDSELEELIEKHLAISILEEQVDMKKMRAAFNSTKLDEDGRININQMQQLMGKLGHHLTAGAMMALYAQANLDVNLTVGLTETVRLKQQIQKNIKIDARIGQLRRLSSDIRLTVEQLQAILRHFHTFEDRTDVICMLFPRLKDEENIYKIIRCLSQSEMQNVLSRLGHLNVFNPFQPYGLYFLNLAIPDEKKLAKIVANMGTPGVTLIEEALDGTPIKLDSKARKDLFAKGMYTLKLLEHPQPQDNNNDQAATKKDSKTKKEQPQTESIPSENKFEHVITPEFSKEVAIESIGWVFPNNLKLSTEDQIHQGMRSMRTNEDDL